MKRIVLAALMAFTVIIGSSTTAEAAVPCHFKHVRVWPGPDTWDFAARLYRGKKPMKGKLVTADRFDPDTNTWVAGPTYKTDSKGEQWWRVRTPGAPDTYRIRFDGNARTLPCTSVDIAVYYWE